MKMIATFAAILLFTGGLFAQAAGSRDPDGGGEVFYPKGSCLTPEERAGIGQMLDENIQILARSGKISPAQKTAGAVRFEWPLRKSPKLTFNSYYATNNFVDQNTAAGLLDYNCGARSYEGHFGTDLDTWPFPWYLYERDLVEVVASAGGVIVGKTDGQEDDHCACSGAWNAIYIQHADGSVAWYGHMKKNSLTEKKMGEAVAQGEYLGVVASSGCSTQPHLHFEVFKAAPYTFANLIDPYKGSCNSLNAETWWTAQPEYREPTLNALLTHDKVPVHGCPKVNEKPNLSDAFAPGATVITAAYFHDQIPGFPVYYRVLKPDNTLWDAWTQTVSAVFTKSWWFWYLKLPAEGPYGIWKTEVGYQGKTYTHTFVYSPDVSVAEQADDFQVYPNPTTGFVYIKASLAPTGQVQIVNAFGSIVAETALAEDGRVDISGLATGVYFFKYQVRGKYAILKIVKI